MRRVAAAMLVALAAVGSFASPAGAKSKFPAFTAPVVDAAGVIPDDAEQRIDAELLDYQQRTTNQIAVAVVHTTGDQALEDYSIDLARTWGVGLKGKDNGVLLLVVWDEHKLRVEVGRGLEGDLTDLQSGRIIRDVIAPRLRDGDPGGAVEAGTQSIRSVLGDPQAAEPVPVATTVPENDDPAGAVIPVVLVLLVFGISMAGVFVRRRGRPHWMSPWIYTALLTSSSSSRGSSGGSGFSFGGGGGGSFGGGGASGSW